MFTLSRSAATSNVRGMCHPSAQGCGLRGSSKLSRSANRTGGSVLAELGAALVFIIPIILLLFDCLFIFIGSSLNDSICRDAARAAASGPPTKVDATATPIQRADAVIRHIYFSNLPMKVRNLQAADVVEDVQDSDVPPKTLGGGVGGRITIATTIDIYPPFAVRPLCPTQVTLKSRHTVPVTYVMPPSPPSP